MPTNGPRIGVAGIPAIYRHYLQSVEPVIALGGVFQGLFTPEGYLTTMAGPSVSYDARTRFLYTELAGGWLFMAFIEIVVLRLFDDLDLWTMLCWGMLLSDALFAHSCAQAVGGWSKWVQVNSWQSNDWLVFWTTAPQMVVRILIVLRVGFKEDYQGKRKR